MKTEKGQEVDQAYIIFNSLCSELDRWYKYVKENKGDKKYTCQSTLVLAKIFQYLCVHEKENPQKPPTKVLKTREEMQTALENRKKNVVEFLRSVIKRKNRVEDGKDLSLGMKSKQESTNMRAQKMMKGRMEPSIMPTVVKVVLIVVQAAKHTTNIHK